MFVTPRSPEHQRLVEELEDAARALGLSCDRTPDGDPVIDGATVALRVVERAHPHPAWTAELVADPATGGHRPGLLVADRISDSARQVLRDAGWSWLDRRGHMRLWVAGLRIDAPVGLGGDSARGGGSSPWTPVGLELALFVLIHPEQAVSARRVARGIGRSPGGTQEVLGRFVDEGLIGRASKLPLLPDLFWEAAAHWPDDGWLGLPVSVLEAAAVVGPGGLLRVDEQAATLGGARIAAAADLPAHCYADKASLRRLRTLAAGSGGGPARTFVRAAPVRWLPENDEFAADGAHPWRVAHPVLCALRLGAEGARGREIVEDWGVVPS